jgi:hypothetical protein
MALNAIFTCLNQVVSLDVLVFGGDCLGPELRFSQQVYGLFT